MIDQLDARVPLANHLDMNDSGLRFVAMSITLIGVSTLHASQSDLADSQFPRIQHVRKGGSSLASCTGKAVRGHSESS